MESHRSSKAFDGPWDMWWKLRQENEGKLKDAITKKDFKGIKHLLEVAYAKPSINTTYEDGHTPLHWACLSGDHKIIALLIKNQANVNACNRLMRTPLHYACQLSDDFFEATNSNNGESDTLGIIKLMLKYGANPNIKDKSGKYAYQHSKDEGVLLFLKSRTNEDDEYEKLR